MVQLEKPGFDTAAFLMSAGLGRRIIQTGAKGNLLFARRSRRLGLFSSEGPCKSHGGLSIREEATVTLLSAVGAARALKRCGLTRLVVAYSSPFCAGENPSFNPCPAFLFHEAALL